MGMGPHVLPPLDAVGVDGRLVASVVVVAQVERLEHALMCISPWVGPGLASRSSGWGWRWGSAKVGVGLGVEVKVRVYGLGLVFGFSGWGWGCGWG